MYTFPNVTRFIQPMAVCVALMMGALPAATLVCQWACSGGVRTAHEQPPHHHHATTHDQLTAASDPFVPSAESMRPSERVCAFNGIPLTAVTAQSVKAHAPVPLHAARVELERPAGPSVPIDAHGTPSPPGARSAPLPLRV